MGKDAAKAASEATPGPAEPPAGTRFPCPFVYANGRACTGHVVRVEAYKADLEWVLGDDGRWGFSFAPRSHYHLFCSEKGNHAGFKRQDPPEMKHWFDRLPQELQDLLNGTQPPF